MPINRSGITGITQTKKYICTGCGQQFDSPSSRFYITKFSPLYASNDGYSGFCVECANRTFKSLSESYDGRTALFIMCHYMDWYYAPEVYEAIKGNSNFGLGLYQQKISVAKYKNKNFASYLCESVDGGSIVIETQKSIVNSSSRKWTNEDVRNKNFVIHTVGYDCFADGSYDDDDRIFLFNTMVDYIGEDTSEDPHKMQSVIALVKTMLQREKIDRLINAEQNKKEYDEKLQKEISTVKTQYNTIISDIANDNAISAKASGKKQAGSNTITYIMKQMIDDGFDESAANIYDAKMSESFREIAAANAKALIDELNLNSDDYARLCAEQSDSIRDMQSEIEKLKEENRMLRVHKYEQEVLGSGNSRKGNEEGTEPEKTGNV